MARDSHPPTLDESGPRVTATRTASRSFESVFEREYASAVALAAAVTGRRTQAEEIAAEAMAKLSGNWADVIDRDRPAEWVRRTTIELALSRRHRFVRRARALLRRTRDTHSALASVPPHDVTIWEAVAALPRQQRAVLALHYLENRNVAQIAEICDMSPATARVHLHRGRAALRDAVRASDTAGRDRP